MIKITKYNEKFKYESNVWAILDLGQKVERERSCHAPTQNQFGKGNNLAAIDAALWMSKKIIFKYTSEECKKVGTRGR